MSIPFPSSTANRDALDGVGGWAWITKTACQARHVWRIGNRQLFGVTLDNPSLGSGLVVRSSSHSTCDQKHGTASLGHELTRFVGNFLMERANLKCRVNSKLGLIPRLAHNSLVVCHEVRWCRLTTKEERRAMFRY